MTDSDSYPSQQPSAGLEGSANGKEGPGWCSQVFDKAGDPIIVHDLSGIVLEMNEEVGRLLGWSREGLEGRSLLAIMPAEYHDEVRELMAACGRGESGRNVSSALLTRAGAEVPVLMTLSLLSRAQDEPAAIVCIGKDVSGLETSEDSRDESRAVAEMHRDIAYMANVAGDLEEAVQFCLEKVVHYNDWVFGHAYFPAADDPEVLLPARSHYAATPHRFARFREETSKVPVERGKGVPGRVFSTGEPYWTSDVENELSRRRAKLADDLGIRTLVAFPVLVGKKVAGVLEFFSDQVIEVDARIMESMASIGTQLGRVVERNEAEQELRESEERLHQLTEQLRDVVWMHDAVSFEVIYCNAAFDDIFGRSRSILRGDPLAFLESVHPRDRKRVERAIKQWRRGEDLEEEFRIVRPDGSVRWLRERLFALRDEDGCIYRLAGTAEDITRRKTVQDELKRLEREVSEAADEERHRIAQDLHDSIGALLSTVNLRLKVLEQDLAEGLTVETGAIEAITGLTAEAITQTRTLTRGLHPVGDDPEDLMVALQDLASSVRAHSTMECRFRCPHPVLIVNHHVANQLFRIAQEAVNNAVKHSGGSRLSIGLRQQGDDIILFVKDNGRGFDRDDNEGSAAGLGLRILRYRADSIGARLKIGPRGKQGTKVVCTLPPEGSDR